MLTKRLFCLISILMAVSMLTSLTDSFLTAQDSLTVFSDTTSILDSAVDTLPDQTNFDDWFADSTSQQSSHSFFYDTFTSLLSFLMSAMGLTSLLAIFIILVILFFPLIAIIAIIVLIYKLQKEKNRNQGHEVPRMASRPAGTDSRHDLKNRAINRFMWGVAMLLLYWLLGWTILAVAGIILLCIAGAQIWRFKSGPHQSENPDGHQSGNDRQRSSVQQEQDQASNDHTDNSTDKQQDE